MVLRHERVEVGLDRVRVTGVVSEADVAVRTHRQHSHADHSELGGYRFVDTPHRRTTRPRAQAEDRVDRRAGAPLELLDQVADAARFRPRTAEHDQRVSPAVGELVQRARIAVGRLDVGVSGSSRPGARPGPSAPATARDLGYKRSISEAAAASWCATS